MFFIPPLPASIPRVTFVALAGCAVSAFGADTTPRLLSKILHQEKHYFQKCNPGATLGSQDG